VSAEGSAHLRHQAPDTLDVAARTMSYSETDDDETLGGNHDDVLPKIPPREERVARGMPTLRCLGDDGRPPSCERHEDLSVCRIRVEQPGR
jgi:hypothetical protein